MIQTVVFDIGGTLLSAPDLFDGLARLFTDGSAYGLIKEGVLHRYRSIAAGREPFATMEAIIAGALRQTAAALGCQDQSPHAFEVYYDTFVTKSALYEDTIAVLDWLKSRGVGLVVASDGDDPLLRAEFALHGLGGYFDAVFISSEVGAYKPNPAFVEALRPAVRNPATALFVGDSVCDVETGQSLGAKTVLKGGAMPPGCNPDFHIVDLAEIIGIVKDLDARRT